MSEILHCVCDVCGLVFDAKPKNGNVMCPDCGAGGLVNVVWESEAQKDARIAELEREIKGWEESCRTRDKGWYEAEQKLIAADRINGALQRQLAEAEAAREGLIGAVNIILPALELERKQAHSIGCMCNKCNFVKTIRLMGPAVRRAKGEGDEPTA